MTGQSVNWTYGMGEQGVAPSLFCASLFEFHKYSPDLYKRKGFFSEGHPPFQIRTLENYLYVNLMKGVLDIGYTDWDDTRRFVERSDPEPETQSKQIMSLFDLSPLETVNEKQWQGYEQITHKEIKTGVAVWTEPALWAIAAVNNASHERFTLIVTHMGRDSVFRMQSRLQSFIDHARFLLDGWEELAKTIRQQEAGAVDEISSDDLRAQAFEMRDDVKRRYKENPLPKWQ